MDRLESFFTLLFVVFLGSWLTGYIYAIDGLPFAVLTLAGTVALGIRLLGEIHER